MLCRPWGLDASCLPDDWDPDDLTDVQAGCVEAASGLLRAMSAGAVGECLVRVRPCEPDRGFPCRGPCGCRPACRVLLSGPVSSVECVTVDGECLPPEAYRLDGSSTLTFHESWCPPKCQRLDRPDGDAGTWSVTYWRGNAPDVLARRAMTAVALTLCAECASGACPIDPRVTRIVRRGTTFDLQGVDGQGAGIDYRAIPQVAAFMAAVNPHGLRTRLRVYSPDLPRTTQTTWTPRPLAAVVSPEAVVSPGEIELTVSEVSGCVVVDWGDRTPLESACPDPEANDV